MTLCRLRTPIKADTPLRGSPVLGLPWDLAPQAPLPQKHPD